MRIKTLEFMHGTEDAYFDYYVWFPFHDGICTFTGYEFMFNEIFPRVEKTTAPHTIVHPE